MRPIVSGLGVSVPLLSSSPHIDGVPTMVNRRAFLRAAGLTTLASGFPTFAHGLCIARRRRCRRIRQCTCSADEVTKSILSPPTKTVILRNLSSQPIVFRTCLQRPPRPLSSITTISIEHGQRNIDAYPHICSPAIVPKTIDKDESWVYEIEDRQMHITKFWFVRDGKVIQNTVKEAATNCYFRDTIVIALLDNFDGKSQGIEWPI